MKEKSKRFAILLSAALLENVDEWRREQRHHPSRAVAIRQLAERGLASSTVTSQRSKGSRRKAAAMADREIERRLADQAVNNEERARRKRQLIQGPREFRDLRARLPKR